MISNLSKHSRRNLLRISAATVGLLFVGSHAMAQDGSAFTFANWNSAPIVNDIYDEFLANYESSRGIDIDAQGNVQFSDYQTRFRVLLASGNPPDVMRLNDDFLREMADKQQLTDLTPLIEASDFNIDDYFQEVWNFTQLPSGHIGVVIGVSPRVVYYNKTAFEEAGLDLPPDTWTMEGWTWDDFLEAAKALTNEDRYGALFIHDTGSEQTFAVNNGGEGIFSEDGRDFTLANSPNVEAIQWLADLTLVHGVQPEWGEIQTPNVEYNMFASGELAMVSGTMGDVAQYSETVQDFEWGIAPFPGNVNQVQEGSMVIFVVPEAADQKDAAWEFLHALSSEEGGSAFAEKNVFVPVNRAAAEKLDPSLSILAEAAAHQNSVNSTIATAEAVALYRPLLELVYTGQMSAEEALGSVKEQIDSLLQEG